MRRTMRAAGTALAATLLVAGLGACGDDDDEAEAAGDTGDAADDALAADGSEGAAEFCDAVIAVDEAGLGLESGEATPEDFDAALQAAEDTAPAELEDAVATATAEARAMAEAPETEDGPPPMPGEAFYPAMTDISAYVSANCDVETIDVTATNYAFAGLDQPVSAGTALINLTNDGTEFHEIALMKIAEGEERPLEELMALPEEETDGLITEKAFIFTPPGASSFATTELDAGRYVAICFVPVGATPEALQTGATLNDEDGHFMHGMVTEFEVA
jgi:hypothetical protein